MMTEDFPPQLVLQQRIEGFKITQCLYAAAKLGIADGLSEGKSRSEEWAQATGTHAPSFYRLLRLL
jgi:Dimerisation domain